MFADLQQHLLMHLAFLVGVVALLLRDQVYLRGVLVLSVALSFIYHATAQSGPMWDDLFWNAVTMVTNVAVLIRVMLDRTHIGLSDEDERLFQAFGSLSPGEFRKLIKLARRSTTNETTVLTRQGIRPEGLFFVLDGDITIAKSGRLSRLAAPIFVGEVAFVKSRDASATVTVGPGTRYVEWPTADLNRHFVKHQAMRVAMMRVLGTDMAAKIALAQA